MSELQHMTDGELLRWILTTAYDPAFMVVGDGDATYPWQVIDCEGDVFMAYDDEAEAQAVADRLNRACK